MRLEDVKVGDVYLVRESGLHLMVQVLKTSPAKGKVLCKKLHHTGRAWYVPKRLTPIVLH